MGSSTKRSKGNLRCVTAEVRMVSGWINNKKRNWYFNRVPTVWPTIKFSLYRLWKITWNFSVSLEEVCFKIIVGWLSLDGMKIILKFRVTTSEFQLFEICVCEFVFEIYSVKEECTSIQNFEWTLKWRKRKRVGVTHIGTRYLSSLLEIFIPTPIRVNW